MTTYAITWQHRTRGIPIHGTITLSKLRRAEIYANVVAGVFGWVVVSVEEQQDETRP